MIYEKALSFLYSINKTRLERRWTWKQPTFQVIYINTMYILWIFKTILWSPNTVVFVVDDYFLYVDGLQITNRNKKKKINKIIHRFIQNLFPLLLWFTNFEERDIFFFAINFKEICHIRLEFVVNQIEWKKLIKGTNYKIT